MTAGARAPFHAVVRKIWPYGLGLAFGTVGFGVIATFITLYFAAHSWQGAAFTLSLFSVGFICVRLVLGNTITRFGGVPVSLACFIIESLGLLLIWLAPSAWMAGVGAFLTGSGFSLVFPALGVEAVKQVEEQNQGTALGTYSAFLDLALGLTGPAGRLGRRVLRSRHAVSAGGDRGGARIPADFPHTSATAACRQRVVWPGSRAAAVR
ncbi:transporter [Klebsiella pneumoniae subsp. rhinoscleromatis]|nr:transporter [Klebsiella pneumoniae subsp. rhinoscleromatis]